MTYGLSRLRADLRADIAAYLAGAEEYHPREHGLVARLSALLTPSVAACALHRLAHLCYAHRWYFGARVFARLNFAVTRVSICPASEIGAGMYIPHPGSSIVFQGSAGRNLKLYAAAAVSAGAYSPLSVHCPAGHPRLGDNVSVGAKAFICGNVAVGDNARIGFNSYVCTDVPNDATVISSAARMPRPRPRGARC